MASGKTALVFGASGISGWAIVRECLSYPTEQTFKHVIALTMRPFASSGFLLQSTDRLTVQSGFDLTQSKDKVIEQLRAVTGIQHVTHVYFTAYTAHGSDYETLRESNVALLSTAVAAVTTLCPQLEFFLLQTGGKHYGVEFVGQPGVVYEPPLKESAPRLPEPYASKIFYYGQVDELARVHAGTAKWGWADSRPDAIVGFTPHANGMGLAAAIAMWLSLFAFVNGKGAEVPFIGSDAAYKALSRDTSQDTLARFNIFASLSADKSQVQGQGFNVADGLVMWEKIWPGICEYFGLKGLPPNDSQNVSGKAWVMEHKADWAKWEAKTGVKPGLMETTNFDFMEQNMVYATFDREVALDKAKSIGFNEEADPLKAYITTFDRMKQANFIP